MPTQIPPPLPPPVLVPSVVIANTASLTGTYLITVGPNSDIHPQAKLMPIMISEHCTNCKRIPILPADTAGASMGDRTIIEVNAALEWKDAS